MEDIAASKLPYVAKSMLSQIGDSKNNGLVEERGWVRRVRLTRDLRDKPNGAPQSTHPELQVVVAVANAMVGWPPRWRQPTTSTTMVRQRRAANVTAGFTHERVVDAASVADRADGVQVMWGGIMLRLYRRVLDDDAALRGQRRGVRGSSTSKGVQVRCCNQHRPKRDVDNKRYGHVWAWFGRGMKVQKAIN